MLEAKKYSIIEWIISLADEKVIDSIQSLKDHLEEKPLSTKGALERKFTASTYGEIKNRKVDVGQLKKEQQVKFVSPEELKKISGEADIKQSVVELLEDLKQLG